MEGMNQIWMQYIYTWKCPNETLCIRILNKNFFFEKSRRQENKTVPILGLVSVGGYKERV
jgi:hypothetical protein